MQISALRLGAGNVVKKKYRVITNDVSDYINLLVRIAHIICNHPIRTALVREAR
jgi:hypothetical protein